MERGEKKKKKKKVRKGEIWRRCESDRDEETARDGREDKPDEGGDGRRGAQTDTETCTGGQADKEECEPKKKKNVVAEIVEGSVRESVIVSACPFVLPASVSVSCLLLCLTSILQERNNSGSVERLKCITSVGKIKISHKE